VSKTKSVIYAFSCQVFNDDQKEKKWLIVFQQQNRGFWGRITQVCLKLPTTDVHLLKCWILYHKKCTKVYTNPFRFPKRSLKRSWDNSNFQNHVWCVQNIYFTHWLIPCPQYVLTTENPLLCAYFWMTFPHSLYRSPGFTRSKAWHLAILSRDSRLCKAW